MSAIEKHQSNEIGGMNKHIMPEMDALGKEQAEMPDDVLVQKCQKWISDLCRTGAKCWSLRVPPDPEHDPDLLFGELCRRFQSKISITYTQTSEGIEIDGLTFKAYPTEIITE